MKITATTLGETLGDYLSMTLDLGYLTGILITLIFFLVVLSIQLFTKKYIPVFYWLVIIATTTLGTEISDFLDRSLHLGYTLGSLVLFQGLILAFILWNKKFKSLSVYPIFDKEKEIYNITADRNAIKIVCEKTINSLKNENLTLIKNHENTIKKLESQNITGSS